jgi:hypothetical protein
MFSRFLMGKCRREEEISRHPYSISGRRAVYTGPDFTIAEQIPNNPAPPSEHFPQFAHYVECRRGIARKYYLLGEGRNQTANR